MPNGSWHLHATENVLLELERQVVGDAPQQIERKASELADAARNAVATTAAVGAGALGLGAIVTIVASTAAADVTGLIMASVVAAVGFCYGLISKTRSRNNNRRKVRR